MITLSIAADIKESLVSFDQMAKSKQSLENKLEQLGELIRFTNLSK